MTALGRNCEFADFKKPISVADIQICMASTKPKSPPDPLLAFEKRLKNKD